MNSQKNFILKWSVILALIVILAACSKPLYVYWTKPDMQPGDFEQARTDCEKLQIKSLFGAKTDISGCLAAKGWTEVKKSEKPPKGNSSE